MSDLSQLGKRDESYTVSCFNNGYMIDVRGRDHDDDEWITVKLICATLDELFEIIREVDKIEVSR